MATPLRTLIDAVRAAPDGPRVGAVFDYDGTLIDGFSGMSFIRDRFRRGRLGPTEAARIAQAAIRGVRTPEEFDDFLRWSLDAYSGRDLAELSTVARGIFDKDIAMRLRPETWALLETHRRKGHTLMLASSGTSLQLEAIADVAGIENVICTRLAEADGRSTGRVEGQPPWGPNKAGQVTQMAVDLGVDLERSFAYSDGDEDVPLLESVGNPTAVNPRPGLRRQAQRRDWPLLECRSVGGTLPVTAPARTAAMYYGFAGGTALAGPVGILKRSTRAFVDATIGMASDLSLGLGGIRVRWVHGKEYLNSSRPCVFIFNHRSNLDAIVMMKAIRKDITAIVKDELRDIPGFGQLFQMADVAFIDRSDSSQARTAIQPALDQVRDDGLSLALAPEGTRWRTPGMGPFRKGAFHIARQTGVPIVPVVMAGCGERLPPGTQLIRPGEVRIAALPPIDVTDWDPADMDADVETVRDRMMTTWVDLVAAE